MKLKLISEITMEILDKATAKERAEYLGLCYQVGSEAYDGNTNSASISKKTDFLLNLIDKYFDEKDSKKVLLELYCAVKGEKA